MVTRESASRNWCNSTGNCTKTWKKVECIPIKLHRQYLKNMGRFVEVIENDGTKKEGKLVSATEGQIVIEEIKGKGKKMETVQHTISVENIKTTKIQIKF